MLINNQFLIGTNYSQDIQTVKAIIKKRFVRYEDGIRGLLERPMFLSKERTVKEYETYLNQRIEWFEKNRHVPLSDEKWISMLSGSIFLQEMAANLCLGKLYSTMGSDLSLSTEEFFTKRYLTYDDLYKMSPSDPEAIKRSVLKLLVENDLNILSCLPSDRNKALLECFAQTL